MIDMLERLKQEVFIPDEAVRTVKILLYVENKPYLVVRDIIEKGRTNRRINLLAKAIEKGYSVDFLLDCVDSEAEDVLDSVIAALNQKVPQSLIQQMCECGLGAKAIQRITAAYERGIPIKSLQLGIQSHMDNEQVKLIMDALSLYNTHEEVAVIANPELDWFQMETILRLYVQGLTVNEAKSITSPLTNCKRLMEMGHLLIANRPQEGGD